MTEDLVVTARSVRPQFHEELEQRKVIDWAELQLPAWGLPRECLFAVPNGAHLAGTLEQRARQMRRLKSIGFLNGVADLLLTVPRRGRAGLWIEMKKPRAMFRFPSDLEHAWSKEQRRFAEVQRAVGYEYALCYGFDEARSAITEYIWGKGEEKA